MENNEYIYIILIKALTGLGKIVRKIDGYEYTHVAMSYDDKLNDFITFSRRKHYLPFDAGFMHEKKEHYAFGNNKNIKVKVFKIPVSESNIRIIKNYVKKIENNNDEYIFNLYSMITMPIFHGIKIYKTHNCMSFVSKIIKLSNTIEMKKDYYKYNIKEIDKLLEEYVIKECYLEKKYDDEIYMKKYGIIPNLRSFFLLNGKLLYRIIFKRNDRYE